MQMQIYTPEQGQPLPPIQWNYVELRKEICAGLEKYKGRVYTPETIGSAKADRATLNKLADAIDGKRKEMKKLYLAPYEEFEGQAKELVALIKEQSDAIDAQVKAYEEARKADKQEEINQLYNVIFANIRDLVPYERVHIPRWLNITTSMKTVESDLKVAAAKIEASLKSIDALGLDNEMLLHVKDVYLQHLDLAEALREKERLEMRREALRQTATAAAQDVVSGKQEEEYSQPQNTAETNPEPSYRMSFTVEATKSQLEALKQCLISNKIPYHKTTKEDL